ncbi:methyltransferase domain-containing protein [Flavihumibacter sp. R14]|nr:methyltransferase domain-containing protein [Flavihumibacter soli]
MNTKLSPRLSEIVKALPFYEGIRVLEIGCGPGALARELATRIGGGHILAIDRSSKAIQLAIKNSQEEIISGRLSFRHVRVEDFELEADEPLYDIAFAVRVGALDGRHPQLAQLSLPRIAKALTRQGRLFIDGGNPLKEVFLDRYRS